MPSLLFLSCIEGFFHSPCEIKCTDEVIDNDALPCLEFLICLGHFDVVNELIIWETEFRICHF